MLLFFPVSSFAGGPISFGGAAVADAELGYLAGLTFADASIIQLTGATSAAVLTSGGNDYFLKSATDNSSVIFASPADDRTALGLVISTNVQAYDAKLAAIAALANGAGQLTNDGSGNFSYAAGGSGDVASDTIWDAAGDLVQGTGANTAAKLTKGAEGTLLRAGATSNAYTTSTFADTYAKGTFLYNASANTVASLAHPGTANYILYTNAADTSAWLASSANMISLLGSADYATARTNLSLVPGTNVQAYSATLLSLAGLTETFGGIPYGTADNAYAWLAAGASGKILIGKGAAAPEWTPYTLPATVPTVGKVLISDGTNLIGSTALGSAAYVTAADYLAIADIDDEPVNGVTTAPISSNYIYDLVNGVDPFPIYMQENNLGFGANNYIQIAADPGTPDATTFLNGLGKWAVPEGTGTPTEITVANEATDQTCHPLFATALTGDLGPKTNAGFTINSNTGMWGLPGITVGALGVTVSKQSGVAGRSVLYEANSTDVHTAGFRGPASITGDGAYEGQLPNARPSSANMVMAWTNAGESGNGTAATPYVQATSWIDLDGYQATVTEGSLADSVIVSADIKDGEITTSDMATATSTKVNRYHQTAHFNPDALYALNTGILVLDPKTTAAITITEIAVYLNENPTTELTVTLYWKAVAIGYTGGTQIDANDTVAGTFVATSSFDDATIPAASKIWLVIGDNPDATTTGFEIALTGTYD